MPKTILGIQLTATEALAVYLKGGWKGATVDRVVRVDLPGGDAQTKGVALLDADLPHADTVCTALPADAAFQRIVELPFSERAKIEQAAPLEAEDSLAMPLEEVVCHVHVLERETRRSLALLVAAPQARVAGHLAAARAGDVDPQILDLEPLALAAVCPEVAAGEPWTVVLDVSDHLCQAVVIGPGGPRGFHAFSAAAGDPALLEEVALFLRHWTEQPSGVGRVFLSGAGAMAIDRDLWEERLNHAVAVLPLPAEGVTVGSDGGVPWPTWAIPLGLALREGYSRTASQVNLLQGPFAPVRESGPWKRRAWAAGIYAGCLLLLWAAGVWSESAYRQRQYDALRGAVRQTFHAALPEVTNVVSEVDQMRARVDELENRAASLGSLVDREVSPLRILREISARIPKETEVEFRDITVEEGRVRLEGTTTSFDATEKIRADLAGYPRFRSIPPPDAKTAAEPGKVLFKLTINLGREG